MPEVEDREFLARVGVEGRGEINVITPRRGRLSGAAIGTCSRADITRGESSRGSLGRDELNKKDRQEEGDHCVEVGMFHRIGVEGSVDGCCLYKLKMKAGLMADD